MGPKALRAKLREQSDLQALVQSLAVDEALAPVLAGLQMKRDPLPAPSRDLEVEPEDARVGVVLRHYDGRRSRPPKHAV
jgi:hypothetical protein